MIKIAKKPLPDGPSNLPSGAQAPFRKTAPVIFLSLLLYVLLPVASIAFFKQPFSGTLFYFYAANIGVGIYFLRRFAKESNKLNLDILNAEEQINILADEQKKEVQNKAAIQERTFSYDNLKKITEELNLNIQLDVLADSLCEIAFSIVAGGRGTCLLYLVDNSTQSLVLFKTRKENKKIVIKAKTGDIFDIWVLRHTGALFIENTAKDFRFDLEKLAREEARIFSSLISTPLVSENRFLGILRLENAAPGFFSQNDLRLLATIGDLGAVAIENSELFLKTRELATHDGLTGLFTKDYFLNRLQEELKRCMHRGTALSLLMLDIDYFKNYNDTFGHSAGDIVLRTLSSIINDFFKDLNPLCCRFGGEEFSVMLPAVDKREALRLASLLGKRIGGTKLTLRRKETAVTVSIGVAEVPSDSREALELLRKADQAMYKAKHGGRNRVEQW